MTYQTLGYAVDGRIATITLNRPGRMNAINLDMPGEIAAAVDRANRDDAVHVIVLTGAGDGFCSGSDLKDFAEAAGERPGSQLGGAGEGDSRPWDPMADCRTAGPGRLFRQSEARKSIKIRHFKR